MYRSKEGHFNPMTTVSVAKDVFSKGVVAVIPVPSHAFYFIYSPLPLEGGLEVLHN